MRIPPTPALRNDREIVDKLGDIAGQLRDRHPDAAEMVLNAADRILRDIELACRTLGVEVEAQGATFPRGSLSLVHSDGIDGEQF